jgi:pilus assembly protein Flp/PilA
MNLSQTIKARIELPCSIRFQGAGLRFARGVTEELSRDSLVIIAFSAIHDARLRNPEHIAVAIELPHSRQVRPRLLECAAIVSGLCMVDAGLRISATVNRMSIKVRESDSTASGQYGAADYGLQIIPAIEGSRNIHRAVHQNHLTHKSQGENSMSFFKNLFKEEEGQDMVEYGLVVALVVVACIAIVTTFGTDVIAGFTAIEGKITAAANF